MLEKYAMPRSNVQQDATKLDLAFDLHSSVG